MLACPCKQGLGYLVCVTARNRMIHCVTVQSNVLSPDNNHWPINLSGRASAQLLSYWLPGLNTLFVALKWRHNERDSVSNHQPHDCFLNRLFRRRSKKTSKLRVTGFCVGNSPGPMNSLHKWPITRKMFPFDDVIMAIPFFCEGKNTGYNSIPGTNG